MRRLLILAPQVALVLVVVGLIGLPWPYDLPLAFGLGALVGLTTQTIWGWW